MDYVRGIIGIAFILFVAFLFSNNKKSIDWKLVLSGLVLQITIGIAVLKVSVVRHFFETIGSGFVTFLGFSAKGAQFLFGDLALNSDVSSNVHHSLGFVFAFQALPTVVFFSAITAALYYLGILQKVVFAFAWVMSKTMRLSGAESLSAAGNVFLGQTEAPLLVRPFISSMTMSELFCLMTGGMATIAGSVMGAYIAFLGGSDQEQLIRFATYLLCASIMNAPAAILLSKIFHPETEHDKIDTSLKVSKDSIGVNLIDAVSSGAAVGLKLALNVGAMLLAFVAIIYAVNWILVDGIGEWTGLNQMVKESSNGTFDGFSLQYVFGQVFRVFAYIMGVDWSESVHVGSLLGQKMVINEFVAYKSLAEIKAMNLLSNKSIVISTYALCGFANFSSIAIQIGGIGGMAPDRQGDLSRLGLRVLFAATLATMLSGTIAGALAN